MLDGTPLLMVRCAYTPTTMKKLDTLLIERSYCQTLIFEKLTPQEIGQLSHLLGKASQVDEKYVGGEIGYQYTRSPNQLSIKLVSSDLIDDPQPPAEESREDQAE